MNLRDQGYRFYVSPDKQRTKWLHPNQKAIDTNYAGWIDVTDWPDQKFADWLMEAA